MRVAVTGASGYIGQVLLRCLNDQGHTVLGFSRHKVPVSAARTQWHIKPDGQPEAEELLGCDAVVHLAGRAHTQLAVQNGVDLFDQANRQLACATAAAAKAAGVARFVQVSTLGVHGNWSTKPVTETSALSGDTPYARSKIAAEQELAALFKGGGSRLTIVRPPMVYGAACPGNFPRLVKLVQSGIPLPFGSVRGRRSFIYVDNLASFLVFCAVTLEAQGIFVIGDGSDFELPELIRAIAADIKAPTRLLPFPPVLLRLAAIAIGRQREIDSLTRPLPVDWSKARATGWTPPITPKRALAAALNCARSTV